MDGLEIPVPLSGVEVEADDAVGKEVGAGPMAPVVVAGRHLGGEIHSIGGLVDGDGAPVAGVARVRPGIGFPRLVALLTWLRNRVEDPETLAGARIETAHVA